MFRGLPGLLILAVLVNRSVLHAQDGVLQRVREEINSERKDEEPRHGTTKSKQCPDQDDFNWWAILGLPFWGPYYALGDDYRYTWSASPPARPYEGFGRRGPAFRMRLSLDDSNNFSGLNRLNGRFLFDTCARFGVEAGWIWLHERLSGSRTDDLVTGHVNLTFRFAQGEHAEFRAGLGARMLTDRGNTRFGFNFTYAADFFPVEPFVISTIFDMGTLGSAGFFHGRITGGVTHNGWELFGGFDYLRIGRVDMPAPVVGVRYWF